MGHKVTAYSLVFMLYLGLGGAKVTELGHESLAPGCFWPTSFLTEVVSKAGEPSGCEPDPSSVRGLVMFSSDVIAKTSYNGSGRI